MLAMRNAELNGLTQLTIAKNDVFNELDDLVAANRKFDVVVLDPPKFARDQHALPQALRGYRRLVQQGLKLLDRDGILVMCCCTGLVTMEMLEDVIAQTAISKERQLRGIMHRQHNAWQHRPRVGEDRRAHGCHRVAAILPGFTHLPSVVELAHVQGIGAGWPDPDAARAYDRR